LSNEESKFIICPNCGAILDKGVLFCGFCGVNVEEEKVKKNALEQQYYRAPQPEQQPPVGARGYPQRGTYTLTPVGAAQDLQRHSIAESKITTALLLSWLAFCFMGAIGLIIAIVSLVLIAQAKKIAPGDPRLMRASAMAIIAIIGSLISIGIMVYLLTAGEMFSFY